MYEKKGSAEGRKPAVRSIVRKEEGSAKEVRSKRVV